MDATHRSATLVAVGLAILWGGNLALWHLRGNILVLDRIESPLADLRFLVQGQRPAPTSVVILAIDDETVQQAGSYPLPRSTVAQLVEGIERLEPNVIALDLLFLSPGPPEEDQALSTALGSTRSVLASAGVFDSSVQTLFSIGGSDLDRVPTARNVLLPIEPLAQVAAVGVVNVATDASGVPRHVPLLLRAGDRLLPSFPLRAASVAFGRNPEIGADRIDFSGRSTHTDLGYSLPLRFYGPRGSIRTISASEVIKGSLEAEAVRGKVVVIGATVTGGGDVFPTAFDPVLPGVEVMATAVAHLMTGDGLVRNRRIRFVDAAITIVLPVLFVLLLAWRRSTMGFAIIAAVALLWMSLTTIVFAYGIWLSATLPLVAAAPSIILFGAARLWLDRRRAETLAQESSTLRHFQPPSLSERLRRDPAFLSKPLRQKAALIFIDLSGFTGLSQTFDPDETREIIREFHTLVDEETVQCHGFVANFMGDGAMIIFGLPEPTPEDACHAVRACAALCSRTQAWLASLPEPISSRLRFKIGAHHGLIVASRLGGASHQHITAIGDTVNVASRLMEVAASHNADLALSEDLFRAAGDACSIFDSGILDETFETSIRGRTGVLNVRLWRCKMPDVGSQADSVPGKSDLS
jgi:adenylate cyclase